MATIKSTNVSIKIYLHNGDTYEVQDDANGKNATAALYDFNARNIVKVVGEGLETLIPFHSILKIEKTIATVETEVENDICKKPEQPQP